MNQYLIIFLILLFSNNIFAQIITKESVTFEKEIRTILCEIETGNYLNAQSNLEKILQKEPRNIFANRLLPGIFSHQIPRKDSPQRIAQIRKSIEAFEKALKILQVSAKERSDVNAYILELYDRISRKERLEFLQKKAMDTSLLPEERSSYYAGLAADFYICANDISELEPVKTTAEKDGKTVFVFTKPKTPAEFYKLKTCVAKGMQMIDKAIDLEKSLGKESEVVWSYKTVLLIQKMRIAEMEGDLPKKERLKEEVDVAKKKFVEISKKRTEKQSESAPSPAFEFLQSELSEELSAYKTSLEKLISAIYVPNDYFIPVVPEPPVAPKPKDLTGKGNLPPKESKLPKGVWKIDSLDGELITEMPGDVKSYRQKEISIYEAEDDDIKFLILSQPKLSMQNPETDEKVLNNLAWSMAESIRNSLLNDKRIENFAIKFLRKEIVSGQTAQIYSYFIGSCQGKTEGVLIVLIGKNNNYAISIRGSMSGEEIRTEGFIESLRIK